jgi:hypothetical protein
MNIYKKAEALLLARFKECPACAGKPGTPELCPSCLHNRSTVTALQDAIEELIPKHKNVLEELGIKVLSVPNKLPKGYLGVFIAMRTDGTTDKKRSCILKQKP